MAEKYGVVPKKFTRDWWEYFWMYYKWHTIITALVIVVTASTIYSSVTAEKFDLTLTYAGKNVYSDEVSQKVEEGLSPLCEDIDENGEKSLFFSQLNISDEMTDPQYTMAMNTKLQLAFGEDETYIFILDKATAERYRGETADECVYAPLEDWLTADIADAATFSAHGRNYGVDLSDCKLFKDLGMDVSEHYLFIRYYPRKDQIKKQLDGYNAAIELANKILSE